MAILDILSPRPILAMLSLSLLFPIVASADEGAGAVNEHYRQELAARHDRRHMSAAGQAMAYPGWAGMGPGMMMAPFATWGMMGEYRYGVYNRLRLSDEQRSKIEAIQRDARKEQLKLTDKMLDEMDKIRDLMSADKRDPSEIGKAFEPVFILRRRMIETRVANMNKIEAVLTKRQREEARKLRRRGMGCGKSGY